jgi:hypothetical protein
MTGTGEEGLYQRTQCCLAPMGRMTATSICGMETGGAYTRVSVTFETEEMDVAYRQRQILAWRGQYQTHSSVYNSNR